MFEKIASLFECISVVKFIVLFYVVFNVESTIYFISTNLIKISNGQMLCMGGNLHFSEFKMIFIVFHSKVLKVFQELSAVFHVLIKKC